MNPETTNPDVRHDALLLIEVIDSNPNGDPDAGNQPRTDPETGQGLITDVSIKRKIRDTIAAKHPAAEPPEGRFNIYVTAGTALNTRHEGAWAAVGKDCTEALAQAWMAERYYDVRMFGAVMTTGTKPAGRLTGPVQVGVARSVDRVVPTELTITRVAKTQAGKETQTEMGSKWIVPYGVYAARIHYSPALGKHAKVDAEDLTMLWSALTDMWDHTRSASRPNIATRGLCVFNHASALGDAPAWKLFETVKVVRHSLGVPRQWEDYALEIGAMPSGVTLDRLV